MKLDEEIVKAFAILNCWSNETVDAEGNAILHRATRYLVIDVTIIGSKWKQVAKI